MPSNQTPHFRKNLLALAVAAALAPASTWALTLAQQPPMPTAQNAFVAPNVIISIDTSGSMGDGVITYGTGSNKTGKGYTEPDNNGKWEDNAKRINVLKYALKTVFNDKTLIPENKLRISWQALSGSTTTVDSATMKTNSMRPIDATVGKNKHRDNFISFVDNISPSGWTPTHLMFSQADNYMRRTLSSSSPWSTDPGGTGEKSTEYLGCRRNYHIVMTDGRWNEEGLPGKTRTGGNQDGKNWTVAGDRQAFSTTSDQTKIYTDNDPDTLSDWAFKSWMDPLQTASDLKNSDTLKTNQEYKDAPATELFSKTKTVDVFETRPKYKETCNWVWKNSKWTYECQTVQDGTEEVKVGTKQETKSVALQKYWNPKYNPATWPHMVTYTIGFSNEAVTWPGASDIIAPSTKVPFSYDNSFIDLVTGWQTWPTMDKESKRSLDMWHASINGRGRFYAVTEAKDLEKAFKEIIGIVNAENVPPPGSTTAGQTFSGFNLAKNNAGNFSSFYNPSKSWMGGITASAATEEVEVPCPTEADPNKKCIKLPDPTKGWNNKNTADHLDALGNIDNRLILSWSEYWDSTKYKAGVEFKWNDDGKTYLSAAQNALLGETGASKDSGVFNPARGINILNFIRGDRASENVDYRKRESRQGDIVNSDIWYTSAPSNNYALSGYTSFIKDNVSRTPMLYVGGNDGMLHGFSATNGQEKIAYVPRGVMANLKDLSSKNYAHKYYVDGTPMTGDVYDNSTWKTMLVGSLAAGGKGYYVLDVTNPSNFTAANAASLVVLDRTISTLDCNRTGISTDEKTACTAQVDENKDLGNITAQPDRDPSNRTRAQQIVRLNNDRWAVVMGNGYNSTNQRAVLLIQYLDGAKELVRIQTTTATAGTGLAADNGLSTPTLVDINGDGRPDVAYAGDNLGNLWKFDLTSGTASDWAVAFGGSPLFTAKGKASFSATTRANVQPITAPPIVRANNRTMTVGTGGTAKDIAVGGMMVAFGTGRNVTTDDRETTTAKTVESLYSVIDNTRYQVRDTSKPKDEQRLKVHPGNGSDPTSPTYVPVPAAVGTMSTTLKLAQQKFEAITGNTEYFNVNAATTNDMLNATNWKNFKGWYLDLHLDDTSKGERILRPMQFWDASNLLAVYTDVPAGTKSTDNTAINESCTPTKIETTGSTQRRVLINIMDGKKPPLQLLDGAPELASGVTNNKGSNVPSLPGLIKQPDSDGKTNIKDSLMGRDKDKSLPTMSVRSSWRQVK